jgi:hypothetical protein
MASHHPVARHRANSTPRAYLMERGDWLGQSSELVKMLAMHTRVFRFTPSSNGYLPLGRAYSALIDDEMARHHSGRIPRRALT